MIVTKEEDGRARSQVAVGDISVPKSPSCDPAAAVRVGLAIGERFEVRYPFVRDTYTEYEQDAEGGGSFEAPTWKPGTRVENWHSPIWTGEDVPCPTDVADAIGTQILTVVGVYKPGRFPTRVFYERRWRDPDGKEFGKTKCRMTTVPAFRALASGYRHPFEMAKRSSSDGVLDAERRQGDGRRDDATNARSHHELHVPLISTLRGERQ